MPEFPPCCVENVTNLGGKLCSWDFCKRIQDRLDYYCKDSGQNPCAPVPQEEYGVECYCCCSCFAYNTPIEAKPGEYILVQDIVQDVDSILAGSFKDQQVHWIERVVDYSSGIGPSVGEPPLEFSNMFYVAYQNDEDNSTPQFILTTVDHLFLMTNGKVKPVQFLQPGDKLVNAHGGTSSVNFVVTAGYKGGLHHIFFDGFNNQTLDNHLVSANGVVCADYSVQLAYSNGTLNPNLVDKPQQNDSAVRVGSVEYQARFLTDEAVAFVNNPKKWPKGVMPSLNQELINIPVNAAKFVTQAQAEDIQANLSPLPSDNTVNLGPAQYLFKLYGAYYPNIIFLIDWNNTLPNAYSWTQSRQNFVLLTGGLLRVPGLVQDGFALILAHMLATSEGQVCVGPADYDAVFFYLRQLWSNNLFFPTYKNGKAQVAAMFAAVDPDHSGPNPEDICFQPGLDCRLETYSAAASMFDLPACANPNISLCLDGVILGNYPGRLRAMFSRDLDQASAETTNNYTITAEDGAPVTVEKARLTTRDPKVVQLSVKGLVKGIRYTLVATDITSRDNVPINPNCNSAEFQA